MRILMLTPTYSPRLGGVETVVRELSTQLQSSGHEVQIVTNRNPRSLPVYELIDGLPVHRLSFIYSHRYWLKTRRFDIWLAGLGYFPLTLFRLYRQIAAFQPDVAHLHYPSDIAHFVWLAWRALKFELVLTFHGGDVDGEPHKSAHALKRLHRILHVASQVTTCSDSLGRQLVEIAPQARTKTKAIPNGVHADVFVSAKPFPHSRRYIAGVGKLVPHKGFDQLVDAFIAIADLIPDTDLILAGDGVQRSVLEEKLHAHHLQSRAHFLGLVTRETVAQVMRGGSAVVIPSRREPYGIVGVEAMASARPILSSSVGGLPEALAGAQVHWIENADDIAHALLAIQQQHEHPMHIEANRQLALTRDWSRVSQEYMQVYEDVLKSADLA
ncbi:MAG: glycosyltransferase family 4 protein [Anaerolineae bacterium]|nr:glycosyltransferase family 4 protein [Anaerolineae bacterium]